MTATIRKFMDNDFGEVHDLVHSVIDEAYPAWYPPEVVDFFHAHHGRDAMAEDIPRGVTLVAVAGGSIVATGSIVSNEIKRMFVLPSHRGRGVGGSILRELEAVAADNRCADTELDASLASYGFYGKKGYGSGDYRVMALPRGGRLCYFRMRRNLHALLRASFHYDNRTFAALSNSGTGEVGGETLFHYRQRGDCVWAEYGGGMINKGFLVGTAGPDGVIRFAYAHVNSGDAIRTGRCVSRPELLADGRIRLHEEWEWTDGDGSKGVSVVEEVKGS